MIIKNLIYSSRDYIRRTDWKLLVFLVLFLNVKLVVKLAALILVYAWRMDFRFGFRFTRSRLPLFYPLVAGIAIFNWALFGGFTDLNYSMVVLLGVLFWIGSILAIHQVKLSVDKNDVDTIHRTILVFFIINSLLSLAVYLGIIIETGHINAYRYQGNFQKYFIGTGDYIKGITLDTSTTNAVLNAFGIVYYLLRNNHRMVLLCMVVLLLTGSNVTNLLLCLVLIYLFIFQTNKNQKSIIVVCLIMLVIFLLKISPQNNKYIKTMYQRLSHDIPKEKPVYLNTTSIVDLPDSILSPDEKKQKIAQLYLDSMNRAMVENNKVKSMEGIPVVKFTEKPVIPKDSIHTPTFQHKYDTNAIQKEMMRFIASQPSAVPISASGKQNLHIPGKILSLQQTLRYFSGHPGQLITGAGMGNFSSKLAFKATAMNIAGGYPAQFHYISPAFKSNHLDLYLYYFTNKDDLHSIANSPNNTYDQLFSEYGIAGLVLFGVFYAGYFFRLIRRRSWSIPLGLIMLGSFFIEYWFEQLSVVVFFELLVLLNNKELNLKPNHESH